MIPKYSNNVCKWDTREVPDRKWGLSPFEHRAGIGFLRYPPHHAAVLQRHALQQPVIHVVPNPNGEDAEFLLCGRAGVPQDRSRLDLPDSGTSIRQENDEGDAVWTGLRT